MKWSGARAAMMGAFAAIVFATAMLVPGLGASPAQAANVTDGFNPGNIVSDANFYDGRALETGQVQSFLDQRVPRCTIGDPGRQAGMVWGNTRIASKCLRNFSMNTQSRPSNAYCAAYAGRNGESAAQIITKVGQACGISQRVLLIMLEKEQSLVTDTWPTVRQFDVAMGYACPDSGPGNSANCDPTQTGFFQQVYRAAWQLKVYRANPNSYNYKPFQNNRIQWHPNAGCGTSNVYIENWATAALYIYTPYRPNQAALNAGWGTGDSCSSYGNRNFHNFYKTWFGDPRGRAGYPAVDAKRAQNAWLGAPTSGYNFSAANGGGIVRSYANGAITWKQGARAAYVITGDFRTYFGNQGGISGRLGWPSSDVQKWDRGRTQGFQGGAVSASSQHGFATVSGAIRSHYGSWALAYSGPLGWPTGEQSCTQANRCTQSFEAGSIQLSGTKAVIDIPEISALARARAAQLGALKQSPRAQSAHGGGFVAAYANGAVTWSRTTGAHVVTGGIRTAFGAEGGVSGRLGWPTDDQKCTPAGVCSQNFIGGLIEVDKEGRNVTVDPDIREAHSELRRAGTDLGASLGVTQTVNQGRQGRVHAFERGAIAVSGRTGAYAVMEPIRAPFGAAGGLVGALGWPTANASAVTTNGGGTVQGFEGGAIASSPAGSYVLSDAMRSAFSSHGGLNGKLGWPMSNVLRYTANGGGIEQTFQGGVLLQRSGSTAPVLVEAEIRQVFDGAGGVAGMAGWPTGEARIEAANGGGSVQGFQNAAIASSRQGTFIVSGGIRAAHGAQGGLTGALGWPTSVVTSLGVEERQSFQGGMIVRNTQTGVVRVVTGS